MGAVLLIFAAPAIADQSEHVAVTLCHATASETNPYVIITVDDDSAQFRAHDEHQDNQDIIPSFTFTDGTVYPGKNLDLLPILENGCNISGETTTTTTSVPETTTTTAEVPTSTTTTLVETTTTVSTPPSTETTSQVSEPPVVVNPVAADSGPVTAELAYTGDSTKVLGLIGLLFITVGLVTKYTMRRV